MHLTIIYAVNDAEEKNGIIQMYFKSLLKKSRYCAFLLFLVILVVRNNYTLLFCINNYSYFRKIKNFRQDYTFIFISKAFGSDFIRFYTLFCITERSIINNSQNFC